MRRYHRSNRTGRLRSYDPIVFTEDDKPGLWYILAGLVIMILVNALI